MPDEKMVRAVARVRVTVEIPLSSVWGGDCRMDQVFDQAATEAFGKIHKALSQLEYRIVGAPVVEAILTGRVEG